MYYRLAQAHEVNDHLPDGIYWQTSFDEAYDVFCMLEAVEYRWTITELMEQPEALLNDVMMIASLHRKMRRLEDKNKNG